MNTTFLITVWSLLVVIVVAALLWISKGPPMSPPPVDGTDPEDPHQPFFVPMPVVMGTKEVQPPYNQSPPETTFESPIGLGLDLTCGTIEPTLKLGGGFGIGMDGDITFNPFG